MESESDMKLVASNDHTDRELVARADYSPGSLETHNTLTKLMKLCTSPSNSLCIPRYS